MLENTKLFDECREHPESYSDEFYTKKNKLVITQNKKLNKLMQSNKTIIENISAYKVATQAKNIKMQATILKTILQELSTEGINFSEFVNYRAIKDFSYSVYQKTLKTDILKKEFLKQMLPEFIKERHNLYLNYGYSFSTLQTVSDSKAHKGNGGTGILKVIHLLETVGLQHFTSGNLNDFFNQDRIYLLPDKTDKELFRTIIKHFKVNFKRSKNHENKQTDCLFKINGKLFIMESKHMKEAGGGQDKQMSEIINFISYQDKEVSYISFLDGVYFNLLSDETIKSGKPYEQRKAIYTYLKKNKTNYFVNTFGLEKLLKTMTK